MLATDHSTGGAIIGGSLKRAGVGGGIIRYASAGRGDVNLSPAEARDLQANGIPIGIVCEHEADWLLRGNVGGRVQGSRDIARACGLPDGVIYMAVDFDCTNGGWVGGPGSVGLRNMQGIAVALSEAANVIGHDNVGFYGSYFGVQWLLHNVPWVRWFWQTEAWSMRQRDPQHCQLFQRAQSMSVAGVSVDIDEIWQGSWGQRTRQPAPKPQPHGPSGHFNFQGSLVMPDGRWSIAGTPSKDAVFGTGGKDKWAVVKHRFCVEGPNRGQHEWVPGPWE